jgi:hypothetical protein
MANDAGYVRFKTEAQRVAALNHPISFPSTTLARMASSSTMLPILKESLRDRLDREGHAAPQTPP